MIALIDNYDSFTWNLYHFLGDLNQKVFVCRNDIMTVEEILKLKPNKIVISPGPKYPSFAGISEEMIRVCVEKDIPLLGVCLGHQAIASALGGSIIGAKNIVHGKLSQINNDQFGIFKDLPKNFKATRYHSLVVDPDNIPPDLSVSAKTKTGTIMGIRHKNNLIEGIQFHPESIATEFGHQILNNFINL